MMKRLILRKLRRFRSKNCWINEIEKSYKYSGKKKREL
jgi:hypothetical protein